VPLKEQFMEFKNYDEYDLMKDSHLRDVTQSICAFLNQNYNEKNDKIGNILIGVDHGKVKGI
jgi:hypothetical protein